VSLKLQPPGARSLLDHLVRPRQQRWRDREAEGFGGLKVDYKVVFRSPLHRCPPPACTNGEAYPSRQAHTTSHRVGDLFEPSHST
jgi:hypothetical protein